MVRRSSTDVLLKIARTAPSRFPVVALDSAADLGVDEADLGVEEADLGVEEAEPAAVPVLK
jgi:hypothetical protein